MVPVLRRGRPFQSGHLGEFVDEREIDTDAFHVHRSNACVQLAINDYRRSQRVWNPLELGSVYFITACPPTMR
jgi:hypothetical protein